MGMGVVLVEVMHVVRADQWQTQIAGDRLQSGVDDALVIDALILHLQEEIARAQDVSIGCRRPQRPLGLLDPELAGHFSLQTAAQPNQGLSSVGPSNSLSIRGL